MADSSISDWGTRGPPWGKRDEREPSRWLSPFPSLEASIGAQPPVSAGELPGVRQTMDDLIAQEVRGGCRPDVAAAQVRRVALGYDRDVRAGSTPFPLRRS